VVAELTARLDGVPGTALAELVPDVNPETTASVALAVAAGYLRALAPASAAAVLRALGLLAASRGETPDGGAS
jgi:hypothetical protein